MIDQKDLRVIADTLAPLIQAELERQVTALAVDFMGKLEGVAQMVVQMQQGGTDHAAATDAYREFIVAEAKRIMKVQAAERRRVEGDPS